MKRITASFIGIFLSMAAATPCKALDVWHSNTGWVQGMCSYEFTLDVQREQFDSTSGISSLKLAISGMDEQAKLISSRAYQLGPFADSDATRFVKLYWEGDCKAKMFIIWNALAVIAGKEHDLLQEKSVVVQESPLKETVQLLVEE